jgi:hypothetical protein
MTIRGRLPSPSLRHSVGAPRHHPRINKPLLVAKHAKTTYLLLDAMIYAQSVIGGAQVSPMNARPCATPT